MTVPAEAPIRVLYLAGSGRSGSTLLTNILGQVDGVFAAGELRFLWQRGVVENHLCGCGRPFDSCPVWVSVMADVAEGGPPLDAAGIAARLRRRLRLGRVPTMLVRRALGRPAVPPHRDDELIARLYQSLARHRGTALVVDSSKLPPYGMLVSQLPGVEVSVLHIVRDPRAAAFSWRRSRVTGNLTDADEQMQRHPLWKSASLWLAWNALTALVWRRGRYLRVRYEDFVGDPERATAAILDLVGMSGAELPFESTTSVRLAPTHSVAGNPNRHRSGSTRIRLDDEWVEGMARGQQSLVSAIAAPGMLWFGYRRGARRTPESGSDLKEAG